MCVQAKHRIQMSSATSIAVKVSTRIGAITPVVQRQTIISRWSTTRPVVYFHLCCDSWKLNRPSVWPRTPLLLNGPHSGTSIASISTELGMLLGPQRGPTKQPPGSTGRYARTSEIVHREARRCVAPGVRLFSSVQPPSEI